MDNRFDQATRALYEGDSDKASQLLAEATAETARQQAALQAAEERALSQLFTKYPEFRQDNDLAVLADHRRVGLEASGISRLDAIAIAGDEVGKKFVLRKRAEKSSAEPERESNASEVIESMRRQRVGER